MGGYSTAQELRDKYGHEPFGTSINNDGSDQTIAWWPTDIIDYSVETINGFISIEFSANLAVIKTRPGYASSLAYDIDNRNFDEILGTIAGDDTIMLVIREGCTRAGVKNALSLIIPNIQ